MAKIVKYVYVMIIIISLFLLAMNARGNPVLIIFIFLSFISTQFYLILVKLFLLSISGYCLFDADCVTPVCNFHEKRKCLQNTCVCRPFRFKGFH